MIYVDVLNPVEIASTTLPYGETIYEGAPLLLLIRGLLSCAAATAVKEIKCTLNHHLSLKMPRRD
jgi:hypothetical protein